MAITLGLLLSALLTSAQPQSAQPPVPQDVVQPARASSADPESTPAPPSTERPHQVGLGGFGGAGGGPSLRYFFGDRIGVDMSAGWNRAAAAGAQGTSFQVSPSMIVMLNKSHKLADLDVRPYVGGGVNYFGSGSQVQTNVGVQPSGSGVGMQVFGGAELTFADAKSIAISAEVRYYRLNVQSFNTLAVGGTNFYLLFHYYMR